MSEPAGETLVVHPGALGDLLQAVPALRALGRRGPVALCAQPRLGELLTGAGAVARHVSFDGFGLEALFAAGPLPDALTERLARFSAVVSWFGSRDPAYAARLRAASPNCAIAPPVPPDGAPVWQHLLATVGEAARPALMEPLLAPEAWRGEAAETLARLGAPAGRATLVAHPGAGGAGKRWPAERMAAAIAQAVDRTGAAVLVHEGPADREAALELLARLPWPAPRLVEPPLSLLAAILAGASAYVGGDSGVSQLAAAMGAPAVIVYPPATRPGWAPWCPTATAITAGDGAAQVAEVAAALAARMGASRP